MYIVIEGIDTAGKSTQLDILKEKYKDAYFTKEPGGTDLGKIIRDIVLNGKARSPMAQLFLFLADRAEHIYQIVKKYQFIISDRGFLSGIAYADLDIQQSLSLNLLALDNILPNKIIILTLSKNELERRLSQKEQDSIEQKGIEYLLNVQERMLKAAKLLQQDQLIDILVIDAANSIEKIACDIEDFINN